MKREVLDSWTLLLSQHFNTISSKMKSLIRIGKQLSTSKNTISEFRAIPSTTAFASTSRPFSSTSTPPSRFQSSTSSTSRIGPPIKSHAPTRSFFSLPDLSKLSSFSQRNDQKSRGNGKGKSITLKDGSQLYTEEKVLP